MKQHSTHLDNHRELDKTFGFILDMFMNHLPTLVFIRMKKPTVVFDRDGFHLLVKNPNSPFQSKQKQSRVAEVLSDLYVLLVYLIHELT